MLLFFTNHHIDTAIQTQLDESGDQAVVNYGIYRVSDDGTEFTQIGSYDGSPGKVMLDE